MNLDLVLTAASYMPKLKVGATCNALDPEREAEESSSDKGSLIGSGGSILGLGLDVDDL